MREKVREEHKKRKATVGLKPKGFEIWREIIATKPSMVPSFEALHSTQLRSTITICKRKVLRLSLCAWIIQIPLGK